MKYFLLAIISATLCSTSLELTLKHPRTPSGRVVGGSNAGAGQFPFAAAVHVQTANARFLCMGAFVGFQWIISSGNCVKDAVLFTIQLGSITLDDVDALILATSTYVLHPDFDPARFTADIGLIKLREKLEFTDYVKPLYTWVQPVNVSQSALVLGWGQTSDGMEDYSDTLQYANVTILDNEDCKKYYGSQITDLMVCVAGNSNEGICIGDNGGPLFMIINYYPWVTGVASFLSGNGCDSVHPSGYTRLEPYVNWVDFYVYGFNRTKTMEPQQPWSLV